MNTEIEYNVIVATDKNGGFGANGVLPWNIPLELKYFKWVTSLSKEAKNFVVMGRKTWDSIPEKFRPLIGRINIVFTQDEKFIEENIVKEGIFYAVSNVSQFEDVIKQYKVMKSELFVIGGFQILKLFEQCYPNRCKMIFHSLVMKRYEQCDVFYEIPEGFSLLSEYVLYCDKEETNYSLRILGNEIMELDNIEALEECYIKEFLAHLKRI